MSTLYERLLQYSASDYYGFHMPGHKRNLQFAGGEEFPAESRLPYNLDITEIDGFDDLHHAEGIIEEAQREAAAVYGAEETKFLVNGSTVGILSALFGTTKQNDTILVARNCHKSVYHAIQMQRLHPVYLYPGFDREAGLNGAVSAEAVQEALRKNPQIKAVMIVSPTYDGVVSDVRAIAEAAHEKGVPLIVDEAHGAHFGFHPYFPENANRLGADIVIHSMHKTLPSLTQTALLHMNGSLVERARVREYLHMLQSSSPSYVLMASMDHCVHLLKRDSAGIFEAYAKRLRKLRDDLRKLQVLRLVDTGSYDPSKLVISTRYAGITGKELSELLLKRYHLQLEMAAGTYALAMTSVADTEEGFQRLLEALTALDAEAAKEEKRERILPGGELPRLEIIETCAQAKALRERQSGGEVRLLPWDRCEGYMALEYAYLYPPGIPLVIPGEKLTKEVVDILSAYMQLGFSVEGLKEAGSIEVWIDG